MIMVVESLQQFFSTPFTPVIVVASLLLCIAFFAAWKKQGDYRWALGHVFFLFLPFLLFAAYLPCTMDLFSVFFSFCSIALTKGIIILSPIALGLAFGFCFLIAPRLFLRRFNLTKKQTGRAVSILSALAQRSEMDQPDFFVSTDRGHLAFSTGNRIVLSQGLLDALSPKELEAVFLHELGHIKNRSSFAKVSTILMSAVSPFAWFAGRNTFFEQDEQFADAFASSVQGTKQYIESARRKASGL